MLRDRLMLEISDPLDNGQIAVVGGQRLAGLVTSSVLGVGFDECRFALLDPGLSEEWSQPAAEAIEARWWLGIARLYVGGESVWAGRIEDTALDGFRTDPARGPVCRVSFTARGLAHTDLTNLMPELPGSMTDEDATVSLSDLVEELVSSAGGAIAAVFSAVQETSTNIGPIGLSDQDLPLDVINAATRTGNGDGEEVTLLVFEPENGPILQPLCDDGTHASVRWLLTIADSGLGFVRNGAERANRVKVTYTDDTGSSQGYGPIDDSDALDLQGGIVRERVVSVDRVGEDGAAGAATAALALRADPRGLSGTGTVQPAIEGSAAQIRGAEGGLEPGWRMRAGDLARFTDLRPQDPFLADARGGYLVIVKATSFNWDTGALGYTPDTRRTTSRPGEDPAAVSALRRQLEPGSAKQTLLEAYSATHQTIGSNTDAVLTNIGDDGLLTFYLPRTALVEIHVDVEWQLADDTPTDLMCGYTLDGESYDRDDRALAMVLRWPGSSTGQQTTQHFRQTRRVLKGEHTIRAMGTNAWGGGSATVNTALLRVFG